ncbi:DUF4232 domain-containing protein [Arsenicicoccus dermatophilus]|uniref:DUF4232 domain-containing protein n=1 Tax=Arsenicicoccus dermatophilus TaxID=1076331 RepID=UPI0039174549
MIARLVALAAAGVLAYVVAGYQDALPEPRTVTCPNLGCQDAVAAALQLRDLAPYAGVGVAALVGSVLAVGAAHRGGRHDGAPDGGARDPVRDSSPGRVRSTVVAVARSVGRGATPVVCAVGVALLGVVSLAIGMNGLAPALICVVLAWAAVILVLDLCALPADGADRWRGWQRTAVFTSSALVVALVIPVGAGWMSLREVRDDLRNAYPPAPTPRVAPPTPPPSPPAPPPRPSRSTASMPRPCTSGDLTLAVAGWDAALGITAASLVITNHAATACFVDGQPDIRLVQAGEDLWLRTPATATSDRGRVTVLPGHTAAASMTWKGSRQMADTRNDQTLTVRITAGDLIEPYSRPVLTVTLPAGGEQMDVVDGAYVQVGPWRSH